MKTLMSWEQPSLVRLDSGFITTMRLVLASSVLFIILPSDLDDIVIFDLLIVLYVLCSAALFVFVRRQTQPQLARFSYWIDLNWATLLTLYSDDSSISFLFLFPALIASFQWSFFVALRMTFIAAAILALINIFKPSEDGLNLPELLSPAAYVLVFGYLMACWSEREITARRRLLLLKEATRLSNPRFGSDRMIGAMLERLRAFYDAESCLMIVHDSGRKGYVLRRADRARPERAGSAEPVPEAMARRLLAAPLDQAVLVAGMPKLWAWLPFTQPNCRVVAVPSGLSTPSRPDEALLALLEAEAFVSVPLHYPDIASGRLYLTSARRQAFSSADVDFVLQVVEQMIPVIENVRLVDQLASSAAAEERRRMARNIHDNVIQSYIGFQVGLQAVSQKIRNGADGTLDDITRLTAVADQQVAALRSYIHQLPQGTKHESLLRTAVQRFVTTFAEATHIAVQIEADDDLRVHDRLAAEVFQLVVEGLSNVRRHAQASQMRITFTHEGDDLLVGMTNNDIEGHTPAAFVPRSLQQRASALGGQVAVMPQAAGGVQVRVRIPL